MCIFDLTSKLTLRGGYRYVWGDATVRAGSLSQTGHLGCRRTEAQCRARRPDLPALAEALVQRGLRRRVERPIYFRTSLYDYHKARARATYQATIRSAFQANFTCWTTRIPTPGIQYDFRSRDNSLAAFWTPDGGKRVSVMAEYDRSTVRSNITLSGPAVPHARRSRLPRQRAHGHCGHRHPAAAVVEGRQADRRRIAVHFARAAGRRAITSRWRGCRCRCTSTYTGTPNGDIMASGNSSTCMKGSGRTCS